MTEAAKDMRNNELIMRNSEINADIRLVKSHQWQATYYSLLLSAGMIAFMELDLVSEYRALLLIPVVVLSVLQAVITGSFQFAFAKRLTLYRNEGTVIVNLFSSKVEKEILKGLGMKRRPGEGGGRKSNWAWAALFIFFGLLGPLAALVYCQLAVCASC